MNSSGTDRFLIPIGKYYKSPVMNSIVKPLCEGNNRRYNSPKNLNRAYCSLID